MTVAKRVIGNILGPVKDRKSRNQKDDLIKCRYCGHKDITKSGVCPECDVKYSKRS